ncbi:hypothetical protein [Paraferrimonas sedimenticola]|uniref:hypothetical protein n=1 Tax=Paraferrimonas sedimenticola TaxID=375674 RepID=UPI001472EC80|nr:hypothetical protein [Paraferrimonas sedimenticola]
MYSDNFHKWTYRLGTLIMLSLLAFALFSSPSQAPLAPSLDLNFIEGCAAELLPTPCH